MARHIQITFEEENITARARLLEDQAPTICQAIWEILPVDGQAMHSMLSGQEIFVILPTRSDLKLPKENATTYVVPGDIAYNFVKGGRLHSFTDDLCEVVWYYGRLAAPQLPDGPNAVSIFARFLGEPSDFYSASERIRTEGPKSVRISRIVNEEDSTA